jgi:23S rRNA (uracil1939-C5)-methyltransferase
MGTILKALTPAYGGYTIARDEKVIFIKGAIPGEVVEVEIAEKKRDYSVANALTVVEPSEHRVNPLCPVFGICGGCQLQYITYEKQLSMKDEILLDACRRLGGFEAGLDPALADAQWQYRCRAQFKVSKEGTIGFFRASSRDIVEFDNCPLMIQEINDLLKKIKEQNILSNLNEVHVTVGDAAVALLKGKDYNTALFEHFHTIGFSGLSYNESVHYGEIYAGFRMEDLYYSVSPMTFLQSHWNLNAKLVDVIMNQLMPLERKSVLDLYAGAGNLSLKAAAHAGEVVAVEENPFAVEDARRNRTLNKIKNCRFVRSSAEKYRLSMRFDVILLDPPRPGVSSIVAKKILDNPSDMLVYVSCNPATLARDLRKFREKYEVRSIRQVDFFPNTFHIESIAFLTIK